MLKMTEMILLLFIWLTGSCVFSFADAAAWRMSRGLDFIRGRSRCDSCGHVLSLWEMIPCVGWILCRGRCRYCGERISGRHMGTELAGGCTALLCAGRMGISADSGLMFVFLAVLLAAALVDQETMEIPDGFHGVILILTAVSVIADGAGMFPGAENAAGFLLPRAAGGVCVSAPMLLLTAAVPGAFGGGDIKLSAVCGLFLGWRRMLLAAILAVLGAGAWGGILLAGGKAGRKDHFAFAPFLFLGIFAAVFWGESLWNGYKMILLG